MGDSRRTGRWSRPGAAVATLVACILALALGTGAAYASDWYKNGWRDQHNNYPPKPDGYTQIVNRFGQPCNDNANYNRNIGYYGLLPDGTRPYYQPPYHKRLGGRGQAEWFTRTGGGSSNMEDIKGHLGNAHILGDVRGGVWGYYCRKVANSDKYSTHAWGIAIDVNAAWEHYPHCHNHTVTKAMRRTWIDHRWTWGRSFCDSMHFQYATGY